MSYDNGKIYKLTSASTEDIYIGSTIQLLRCRLSEHKYKYKLWKKGKHNWVSSYDIVKYDNVEIELLEAYPCEGKTELRTREKHYCNTLKCLNVFSPITSKAERRTQQREYNKENKEKIKLRTAQYYQENKEHLVQKKKEWLERNPGYAKKYHEDHYEDQKPQRLARQKAYRSENKELIAAKNKIYNEKNKVRISQYQKEWYKRKHTKEDESKEELSVEP